MGPAGTRSQHVPPSASLVLAAEQPSEGITTNAWHWALASHSPAHVATSSVVPKKVSVRQRNPLATAVYRVVGPGVGLDVGAPVGTPVGLGVGAPVGLGVGLGVGLLVGAHVSLDLRYDTAFAFVGVWPQHSICVVKQMFEPGGRFP